ncbi:MAG: hypothetical protein LUD50_03190 [Clostridia bacterium]|nr:hypothetical protein [Clostridia bacterium]
MLSEHYTLRKETLKDGSFLYSVLDESGNVIKTRKTGHEYVACCVFDNLFFGKVSLIGKGEHARRIAYAKHVINGDTVKMDRFGHVTDLSKIYSSEERNQWRAYLVALSVIAYLPTENSKS